MHIPGISGLQGSAFRNAIMPWVILEWKRHWSYCAVSTSGMVWLMMWRISLALALHAKHPKPPPPNLQLFSTHYQFQLPNSLTLILILWACSQHLKDLTTSLSYDRLTGWVTLIPTVMTLTSLAFSQLYYDHWVSKYGIPTSIVLDRDKLFTATS